MNRVLARRLAALSAILSLACGEIERAAVDAPSDPAAPLSVYVVNYPLLYFAERIGGDQVRAVLPVPPEVDPAFWQPDPETVARYQQADLVLENGAGYARWLAQASLPRARRVDTSAGFRHRFMELEQGATHGHGPSGEHTHRGTAFTTWLDPRLAIEQARAVAEALSERRPEAAAAFRSGFGELESELRALDQRLAAALLPLAGQPLLFSHPVYQYFARRYALTGRALDWEPGVMPSEAQWREVAAMLAAEPARWMLFEGTPNAEAASRLASLGVRVVVVAPAANRPLEGDWLTVMNENAARLEAAGIASRQAVRSGSVRLE